MGKICMALFSAPHSFKHEHLGLFTAFSWADQSKKLPIPDTLGQHGMEQFHNVFLSRTTTTQNYLQFANKAWCNLVYITLSLGLLESFLAC